MTRDREEQIIKASQLYPKHQQKVFVDGAMWADEHPTSIGKILQLRRKAYADGQKRALEKACELLARMVWEVTYEDLEGNSIHHYDKMEFIEDFKKAMEEKI